MNRASKLIVMFVSIFMLAASHAGAASISIQPTNLLINAGQSFSLAVNASNVTDLFAYQLDVAFDPTKIAATSITEGAFLPSGGTTFFIPGTIDNVNGTIDLNADSLIGAIPGATGSGTLLTFQFTALHEGISPVSLANILLLNSASSPITVASSNGSVTIQGLTPVPLPSSLVLMSTALALGVAIRFLPLLRNRSGIIDMQ
jgi:Cohesin domain